MNETMEYLDKTVAFMAGMLSKQSGEWDVKDVMVYVDYKVSLVGCYDKPLTPLARLLILRDELQKLRGE